jgi:[acyl-carrier-protein] S-malonyltransferase
LEGHKSFERFSEANEILGYEISKMMFEGPEEDLRLTANTQPAIVSYSVALYEKLKEILDEMNVSVDRVLGHSVGEYAALVAAGALPFKDAVKAVNLRGSYMQEAVPAGVGSMYAVMRVDSDLITKACKEVSTEGSEVMAANYNEPGQTVISGEAEACKRAVKWLEENGADKMRAMELKVSAPFHSTLMKPAEEKLKAAFETFNFSEVKTPYIANITAKEQPAGTGADTVKENLLKQVCGSVLWSQSIAQLPSDTICIEVGPGKVLAGLSRKINRDIKVISLDKEGAFDELKELLA